MVATRIDMHSHFYGGGLVEMLRARTARPYLRRRADGVEVMVAMNGEFPFSASYHDHRVGLAQMAGSGMTKRLLTFPGALGVDVLPVAEVAQAISAYNDHLSHLRDASQDALTGLAGVPLADMDLAAKEVRRIRSKLRLPGIILPSNYFNSIDGARILSPVLEAANEVGCHVMLHPGLRVGEDPPPPPADFVQYRTSAVALQSQASQVVLTLVLSDILDLYPRVSFQVVNLGGTIPFIFERIERIAQHRNASAPFPTARLKRLYYDCASLGPRALEAAVKVYGADRIMMGSDYPIFHDDPWETAVSSAHISASDKKLIAHGNAELLFARLDELSAG